MQQQAQEMEQQKMQMEEQREQKFHDDEIQVKIYDIDTRANTDLTVAQIKENIQIHKDSVSTEGPGYKDIMTMNLKQQEQIYKRDIEQLKLEQMKRKVDVDETSARDKTMHDERKLALQSERNDIEKEKIKMMKKKTATNKKQ